METETTKNAAKQRPSLAPHPGRAPAGSAAPPLRPCLELILQRNEVPTADNPLTYRERAFAIAPGISLGEAEAALQQVLTGLQAELATAPRGQFINLAVFDHKWSEAPRHPPLMVLDWRDWRGEPTLQYLTTDFELEANVNEEAEAERLVLVFEALQDLPHARSVSAAMDAALELVSLAIPCEASSACLYDINTDELRFVAVRGQGAAPQQGRAINAQQGLLGQIAQYGDGALRYRRPQQQAAFDSHVDSRPGMRVESLLLRPLRNQGQLLGILQLLNRTQSSAGAFTPGDLNLINYVGERLSETLANLRGQDGF